MSCFRPIQGWRSFELGSSGKRKIVFKRADGFIPIQLPCGQCTGCRLERSRQWAIRCVHEASLHDDNCFITLTFNDEHLPKNGSLDVRDFQLFMKRLRKKFGPGIRYYHCGEYGSRFGRPHYHACVFGFDFSDKRLWKEVNGQKLYTSAMLEELWPFGFSTIGTVTFESAAYVARYIMKKINGDEAPSHYAVVDSDTAEILLTEQRQPEYTTMSRRPGLGKSWFDKYASDVYPDDFVVISGKKMRPPKFYDVQFELDSPEVFASIKRERLLAALSHADNCTPARLAVREQVQLSRMSSLVRIVDSQFI